jgi:hypothetical protein
VRRTALVRHTPLPRSTKPIARHARLRPINPERRAKLFKKHYDSKEYVEHLHAMPCAICGEYGWTEAAHTKSRGAGGKASDLVPLCGNHLGMVGCHQLFDSHDEEVEQHRPRLVAMAKELWNAWQNRSPEPFA